MTITCLLALPLRRDARKGTRHVMTGDVRLTRWLQRRSTNQEPIDIRLLGQIPAVLLRHAAPVDNPRLVRDLTAHLLPQELADRGVHLLRLLRAGHLARPDGPDGLVRNHNIVPVLDLPLDRPQLCRDHLDRVAALPLLQRLAAAQDHVDAALERGLGLGGDELVVLLEDDATFAVAQEGPGDGRVLELADGNLPREGPVGAVKDVLGGDFDAGAEVLAGEEEVEGWRRDDDLWAKTYWLAGTSPWDRVVCSTTKSSPRRKISPAQTRDGEEEHAYQFSHLYPHRSGSPRSS